MPMAIARSPDDVSSTTSAARAHDRESRVKVVYKITSPNGNVYVGSDL